MLYFTFFVFVNVNRFLLQFFHLLVIGILTSNRLAAANWDLSRITSLTWSVYATFAQASLGVLLWLDGRIAKRF